MIISIIGMLSRSFLNSRSENLFFRTGVIYVSVLCTYNIIQSLLLLEFLDSSISFGRPGVEFYGQHSVESGENAVTKIVALPNEVRFIR